MFRIIFSLFIFVFILSDASSGPYAWSYATYIRRTQDSYQGLEQTRSDFLTSLSVGWVFDNGLLLGGIYSTDKIKEEIENSFSLIKTDSERESLGAVAGWVFGKKNGFFITGSYFIDSSRLDEVETNGNLSSPVEFLGIGGELLLGYRRSFNRLHISFHLAYRLFSYDQRKEFGTITDLARNEKDNMILPVLGIWTQF